MVARALDRAGLDPTALIGGELADYGGNAKIGRGEHAVAEVDESDGSLLQIHPLWTIITNLEMEHHDHYRDEAHLADTFARYLSQIRPEGGAILWHDDPHLTALRESAPGRVWTYSADDPQADYLMIGLSPGLHAPRFTVAARGEGPLCNVALRVPGLHNALNATAVVALAHQMGLDLDPVAQALGDFGGARRRFDRRGTAHGVTVIDDYAHHPTEIRATLRAARAMHPDGRLVAVFQPHRFSRTRSLWREFAGALSEGVDHLVVTDVYGAGETPINGISGRMIFEALGADQPRGRAFCPTLTEAVDHLRRSVQPGDWVMTLGAGDVWRAGEDLLECLVQDPTDAT
jgi:UDP-N-acetylmuramate--alanine ligase